MESPLSSAAPEIREPSQQRAAETLERLLVAGSELLAERGFEGFKFADVSKRAGVSYGAMQYRVATKEVLLHAIYDRFIAHADHTRELLDPEAWDTLDLEQVIEAAVRQVASVYSFDPPLMRAISLRAASDPSLLEKVTANVHRGSRNFCMLLTPRLAAAGHPDPVEAPAIVFSMITGSMVSRIIWPDFHIGAPLPWEKFLDDIVETTIGKLTKPLY